MVMAAVALLAVIGLAWSLGMARSRSLLSSSIFEAEKSGFNRGWKEARKVSVAEMEAAKSLAEVAQRAATDAVLVARQKDEFAALMQRTAAMLDAQTKAIATVGAKIDVMDQDVNTMYVGFEEALLLRRRGSSEPRQTGEPMSRPPPLPDPKQN